MQAEQETSLKENFVDFFFRNHEYIFIVVVLLGPVVIVGVATLAETTIYQNIMLGVGWTQAAITGYLSFKIFEVSKRDSELPNLAYKIVEIENVESPYENHHVVRCTVRFRNLSYGRAKIKDVDISADFDEHLLEQYKTPGEGMIAPGFPEGRPVPTILDKGEQVDITFQINGFNYLDTISLVITDEVMGEQEFQLRVSEISNHLTMKRRSHDGEGKSDRSIEGAQ